MSRRIARESIFKLVFEYLFCKEENAISLENALATSDEAEREYISSTYHAAITNISTIAGLIEKHSLDFSYERIYKVDLSILFVAISEMLLRETPNIVAVNEAVELAKKYSTEKSPAFINGVLAAVISDKDFVTTP